MSSRESAEINPFGNKTTLPQQSLASGSDTRLPLNLQARLSKDLNMPGHYSRMTDINNLDTMKPNSGYGGNLFSCCHETVLVKAGHVGLLMDGSDYYFLAPGYHKYATCGTYINGQASLALMDVPVVNGPTGFVTISEGRIGILQVMGEYKLLAPGTYQWFSVSVSFIASVDIRRESAALGPYTLVTVPEGHVGISFHNGDLVVLGATTCGTTSSRTYFLDDPMWILDGSLSLQNQCDRLEDNDLLSRDNVELLMVAMSQWKIVDPVLAVTQCGSNMEKIRQKVNSLVRAAIARIVAGANIGSGPVSGGLSQPIVMAREVNAPIKETAEEAADLTSMMKSEHAQQHMAELTANMSTMGIHVIGVFVPEKRIKSDDIRREIAKQAVIGIKAEAERSAADASAYATVASAKAQAQAIKELAKAHAEAGKLLGNPNDTAARLALTEKTAEALKDAKVTIFSGSPGNMPFMLNAQPQEMR